MQINHVPTPLIPDSHATRADAHGATRTAERPLARVPAQPQGAAPSVPRASVATPSFRARNDITPPEGTDPKLWSILTTEERTYFARPGVQGPLTYARVMMADSTSLDAPLAPATRGFRLDVRG